jgi:hypothetical protein
MYSTSWIKKVSERKRKRKNAKKEKEKPIIKN